MKAGFTGTRYGMTGSQVFTVERVLASVGVTSLSHGSCVGADAQVDAVARDLGISRVAWPGLDRFGKAPHRAECDADVVMPPAPYLRRNQRIVDSTDFLIAAPAGAEEARSGTWSTVRYAVRQGKRVVIVMPDGSMEERP